MEKVKLLKWLYTIFGVIGRYFTVYSIIRDHSNKTQIFIVGAPYEINGIGMQIRLGKRVVGISIHNAL